MARTLEPALRPERRLLGTWSLPSEEGNERLAMRKVIEVVAGLPLAPIRIERLKTAVSEATMNAIEHGNKFQADLLVVVEVLVSPDDLVVRIIDHGGQTPVPEPEVPDLDAKLAGLQSPRGWGLFLIKNLVDEMQTSSDGVHHIIEFCMRLEGGRHGGDAA
jgi:anti-sigma regulatory factor (Ser/Thr protein kinase)